MVSPEPPPISAPCRSQAVATNSPGLGRVEHVAVLIDEAGLAGVVLEGDFAAFLHGHALQDAGCDDGGD
jgi:hypothetical protein